MRNSSHLRWLSIRIRSNSSRSWSKCSSRRRLTSFSICFRASSEDMARLSESVPALSRNLTPTMSYELEFDATPRLIYYFRSPGRGIWREGGDARACDPHQGRRVFRKRAAPLQAEVREIGHPLGAQETPALRKTVREEKTQGHCRA